MTRSARGRIRFRITPVFIAVCFTAPLQADPPANATYTYDDLSRLRTGQFSDGRKADYQYDPAGNRTTMTSGIPAQLVIGAATVSEGASLSFPVTRTGSSTQNITVSCVPQNGSAVAGGAPPLDDYVNTAQPLVFYPSDPTPTTKQCIIATKTDSYYEGTQTVTATLQNASAGTVITTGSAVGTILDANSGPMFSVSGSSSPEGAAVNFTITKSGLTELSHNVSYATSNGSATTADGDYSAIGSTVVTFSSGQTTAPVAVSSTADGKYEAAESVVLNLSSPTNGAGISVSSASGTISNDDGAPAISINSSVVVNEGSIVTLTVQNVGNTNTAFTHSISWATANNTATAGTDYNASSSTVSFSSGETTKSIQVQSLTDGVYEGGVETFFVNLSVNGSTNGAVINNSQGLGGIADLDNPLPSVPVMNGPPFTQNTTGSYLISWAAATGPVAYYILEEEVNGGGDFTSFAPYTINAPSTSRSFSGKSSSEYRYRVKACSSGGTCSGYSSVRFILVCDGPCE